MCSCVPPTSPSIGAKLSCQHLGDTTTLTGRHRGSTVYVRIMRINQTRQDDAQDVGSEPGDEEGDTMTRRAEGRRGRPPLPPGVKNERFSCYVTEAVREGLDDLAHEHRTTRTNLVRAILTDYVAARRALPGGICADGDAQQNATSREAGTSTAEPDPKASAGGRP